MAGGEAYRGLRLGVALLAFVAGCGGRTITEGAVDTSTGDGTGTATGTSWGTGTGTSTDTLTDTGVTATGQSTSSQTWVDTAYAVCSGSDPNANYLAGAQLTTGSSLERTSFSDDFSVEEICLDLDGTLPLTCHEPEQQVGGQWLGLFNAKRGSFWLAVLAPDLAAKAFKFRETVKLTLESWPFTSSSNSSATCQRIQLSRAGVPIVFAHSCFGQTQSLARSDDLGVPKVVSVGDLKLTDSGVACAITGAPCDYWYHSVSVEIAGIHATVFPGQKGVPIGDYSFTLSSYRDAVDRDHCKSPSDVRFIAIRRP